MVVWGLSIDKYAFNLDSFCKSRSDILLKTLSDPIILLS